MAKQLHEMTEEERGDYYYEHRDDDSHFSKKAAPIRVRPGGVSTMFSLRIPAKELTLIGEAAHARGQTVSDFIRKAALAAVANEDEGKRASALGDAKKKAKELVEALSKL